MTETVEIGSSYCWWHMLQCFFPLPFYQSSFVFFSTANQFQWINFNSPPIFNVELINFNLGTLMHRWIVMRSGAIQFLIDLNKLIYENDTWNCTNDKWLLLSLGAWDKTSLWCVSLSIYVYIIIIGNLLSVPIKSIHSLSVQFNALPINCRK